MFKYHKDGTSPDNGEIFVFGSNLAGIHGAGAAKAAIKFGAEWGVGFGLTGQSWAIPTKDKNVETLPLTTIEVLVDSFVIETYANPHQKYFVTRVGCGLAGYIDSDIAPLFKRCNTNCSFAEEWKEYLENDSHQS